MSEIAQDHFGQWVKYHHAFNLYRLTVQAQRDWPMEVHVYWGAAGTGKSRRAFDENPAAYWLAHSNGGVWFDGYNGQSCIIIDDFYGWLPWSFLLRLLDRYPMHVPVKGGHIPLVARKIVFTSNQAPIKWYDFDSDKFDFGALERRITHTVHFSSL